VGVVYDELMMLHRNHNHFHPERPERIMAVYLNLVKKEIYGKLVPIAPDRVSDADLLLAHSK
jgi:acetoin utilization deacetylase AcuC-like enzyme